MFKSREASNTRSLVLSFKAILSAFQCPHLTATWVPITSRTWAQIWSLGTLYWPSCKWCSGGCCACAFIEITSSSSPSPSSSKANLSGCYSCSALHRLRRDSWLGTVIVSNFGLSLSLCLSQSSGWQPFAVSAQRKRKQEFDNSAQPRVGKATWLWKDHNMRFRLLWDAYKVWLRVFSPKRKRKKEREPRARIHLPLLSLLLSFFFKEFAQGHHWVFRSKLQQPHSSVSAFLLICIYILWGEKRRRGEGCEWTDRLWW